METGAGVSQRQDLLWIRKGSGKDSHIGDLSSCSSSATWRYCAAPSSSVPITSLDLGQHRAKASQLEDNKPSVIPPSVERDSSVTLPRRRAPAPRSHCATCGAEASSVPDGQLEPLPPPEAPLPAAVDLEPAKSTTAEIKPSPPCDNRAFPPLWRTLCDICTMRRTTNDAFLRVT